MKPGSRVLVTGASGFIGRHLCRRLHALGHDVFAAVRRPLTPDLPPMQVCLGDLTDAARVRAAFHAARPDVVFHLAAHNTGSRDRAAVRSTFDSIVAASLNVFDAALDHGSPRVVTIGSLQEPDAQPNDVANSPYAAAKLASSAYARLYARLYALPVRIARVFMVYGPDEPNATKVIPYVATRLLAGDAAELSSGAQAFDWIFVDDVVDALVALAARDGLDGQTLDVGTGRLTTVRAMVEGVAGRLGAPDRVRFGVRPDRAGEPTRVADVAATADRLGWTARCSVPEGLERTVAWYRARHAESSAIAGAAPAHR